MITADLLGERARLTPDAPALVVVEPPLRSSYGELDRRCRAIAAALRALGVGPGDRYAILAHNRVEYLEVFFAAGKTGAIVVTLGTRLTAHELAPILDDAGAKVLFYDGAFADTIRDLRPRTATVEKWVALDQPADARDPRYPDLQSAADPEAFVPARCEPEDVFCLLYTSGTTGRPKGVMIPHRMLAWNGYNTVCSWQLRADDVSPIFTPLYHAGGLMAFLVPIFTIGGTIVLHRGFDPEEIWRTVAEERCTVVLGVPTIWKLLMEAPSFPEADLSSLRCLYSGGAPLPAYLAEVYQARGLVFKQGFGMTEVGVNCFAITAEDSRQRPGSIGKPLMFTEVRLVGPDGDEVATGEVGEMWFKGPHVSLGYWKNPEATTASRAGAGGEVFRSGDLARRDEQGFFYVAGRAKEMFISGGVNVYPAEIEAVLVRCPGVRDGAVVGIDDPTWGEVGIAFVAELAPGSAVAEHILLFLGERLARYKLPRAVVVMDELPRTAYGKVVKGDLARRWLERQKLAVEDV